MRVFRLSFFYKIVRYFVYSTGNVVKQMNSEIRIKQLEERDIQAVISICLWMLTLSCLTRPWVFKQRR